MDAIVNSVSDGKHSVVTSILVKMDNGEQYVLTEVRPTASTCLLQINGEHGISVLPVSTRSVQIGRD